MIQWAVAYCGKVLGTYADEESARAEWARFPDDRSLLHREVGPWEAACNCQRNELGMVGTNSGRCPVHPLPGCPNPGCGETWVQAFHGDRCDSCGWTTRSSPESAEAHEAPTR